MLLPTAPGVHNPNEAAAPYFDQAHNAWVLSRYADVLAALREPALEQMREPGKTAASEDVRTESRQAISQLKLNEFATASSFEVFMERLPVDRTVDLIDDVIRPWAASCFMSLVSDAFGPDLAGRYDLRFVARHASGGETEAHRTRARSTIYKFPEFARLRWQQKKADTNLLRLAADAHMPGLKQVFLGITQTFPAFLANSWLALLQDQDAIEKVKKCPESISSVIEDLLRTTGLVHTLTRTAADRLFIAGITIQRGEIIFLKIAAANCDPELDADRRHVGHLALGAGAHSCVGASFVRKTAAAATLALFKPTSHIELAGPIEWSHGAVLSYPRHLPVRLRRVKS